MKQFTDRQMAKIRQRAVLHQENTVQYQGNPVQQPDIIATLIAGNQVILDSKTQVPTTGIATWNHYYYCPDHGVMLEWDRHSPTQHRCPIDSHLFSGEPYDGAWWRALNGLNAKACNQLGLLWQLTGEIRYFEKVRDILINYARYYPDYEVHGGYRTTGRAKPMRRHCVRPIACLILHWVMTLLPIRSVRNNATVSPGVYCGRVRIS